MQLDHNLCVALLNEHEAAKLLHMSVAWIRKRRREGKAPFPIRLSTAVRYRVSDIQAYIESLAARNGGAR
jgi:predicted DNA-binding transcriptional regulator AlpA